LKENLIDIAARFRIAGNEKEAIEVALVATIADTLFMFGDRDMRGGVLLVLRDKGYTWNSKPLVT